MNKYMKNAVQQFCADPRLASLRSGTSWEKVVVRLADAWLGRTIEHHGHDRRTSR
jgi:hypothetical protein